MGKGVFIWIGAAVLIVGALPLMGKLLPDIDNCTSASSAIYAVKPLVTSRLASPSTAEFPSGTAAYSAADLGQCHHRISGYFDAQNLSGAMVRSRFEAVVSYSNESDDWFLEDLSITE
jgi:hypothetical protein